MDWLWLTPAQARQIARHALDDAPHEACGLIGGLNGRASVITPAPNVASQPDTHYEVDPATLVATLTSFERNGLDLIGIYHSHPNHPPAPSASDLALALYPDTAYLIVSLQRGEPELAAWTLTHGRAERIHLHIAEEPPQPEDAGMSSAQRLAVILAALLAVAAFLMISISLLPPAPRIPAALP